MSTRPDAVMISESYKGDGETQYQRINAIADITDKILQVDAAAGESSHIRKQPGGSCFVTRDPHDSIRYPKDHPHFRGQDRYQWEPHPTLQGVRVGHLKEGSGA